jgi:nucleoside-diphosphate-sugar epimerase
VTQYGRSKLAAERAALSLKEDLPITILRPPLIYGPREREVMAFFKAVKTGVLPFVGSTNNTCSVVYGADAARACILALDKAVPSGSIYFLDDGRVLTIGELVGHIETALRMRAKIRVPIPRRVLKAAALASELYGKATGQAVMLTRDKCNELWAPHWVCSAQKASRDLQWRPEVQFPKGAELTARWYLDNGWL